MTRKATPTKLHTFNINNVKHNHAPTPPIVADTGATAHFFTHNPTDLVHTTIPISTIQPTPNGISVLLPNKATMRATHTGILDIPRLPLAARKVHLFPHLASGSLLSLGQLCDAGCLAIFDKHKLNIYYQGKPIMQGTRQPNKLYGQSMTHNITHSIPPIPTVTTTTTTSTPSSMPPPSQNESTSFTSPSSPQRSAHSPKQSTRGI